MKPITLSALLGLAMFGAAMLPASAEDFAGKAINTPDGWGVWGPAKVEVSSDASVEGGTVKRVIISPKPANPWDVGLYANITKPVQKGDVIVFAFWARAERPPAGNDFLDVWGRVYETAPPSVSVTPEQNFLIGKAWKLYYSAGTAAKDYPAGTLSCGMQMGTGDQIIDFGPVYVADFGPGYDVSRLARD